MRVSVENMSLPVQTSGPPGATLAAGLAAAGVARLFGMPGGGPNLDMIGAAADRAIGFTLARGETAACIMAATYGLLTGTPGVAVAGGDGRPNLTPVWFDYEGETVLLNLATHRKKVEWLRRDPHATFALMNPANAYHWVSLKCTVVREISEDDPEEGPRVTAQLDRIWTKYTGNEPPYGLRDPSIDERRVLFEMSVDRIATFGKP